MHFIPTYVYVLFCVLVYLGIRRSFARTTRPERLLVFPFVFLAFGAASLDRAFPGADASAYALAFATLAAGAGIGWLHASRWRLQFNVSDARIKVRVPGDPSLLVTLMLAFAIRFIEQYAIAIHAAWSKTGSFEMISLAAWGLLAGMPFGRATNVVARALAARRDVDGVPTFD